MAALREKRLFLLDMDGTIYLDDRLFDGVIPFLQYIRRVGGRYLFLTNNSSRGVEGYIEKMRRLGIETERSDYLTSVDVTIAALQRERPEKKCYVFGTRSFYSQLRDAGIPVTVRPDPDVDILLCGFDRELTFQKLEDACILLNRGAEFWATNPDWVCPTWYGSVPDCGSVCRMLGFAPEQTVLLGDRLYTDIACGAGAGIDTVFVLSGEGTEADIEKFGVQPTWVRRDIAALLQELEDN